MAQHCLQFGRFHGLAQDEVALLFGGGQALEEGAQQSSRIFIAGGDAGLMARARPALPAASTDGTLGTMAG